MNLSSEAMWQAVVENDSAFDSEFVYAVQSTGIYCRPSCKSRQPKRENVAFFATCRDAEQNGFRACKRCAPKQENDPQTEFIAQVCEYIQANAAEKKLTLNVLADVFHVSPYHLQRTFKSVVGISPRQYAESVRVGEFKANLRSSDTVTMAIYSAGFGSSSGLYEKVDRNMGIQPASYKKGGAGAVIRYTTAQTDIGTVMIAATEKGICKVTLGEGADALVAELRDEFFAAEIVADDDSLTDALEQVLGHIAGDLPHIDLPLDVQATAFQKKVWEALRQIPYGETRTYKDIAVAIDSPKASRAVGRACATNSVALVIPCHRVIKSGGDVNHYRWGKERKSSLLQRERANTAT